MTEKQERPSALPSETHRIDTGYGRVYVTVSLDENGRPHEVFVNMGQSGGLMNAWCEALGKVISAGLRSGVDPSVMVDQLVGIKMDKVQEDNGDRILSIPDAVGIGLKRTLLGRHAEPVREIEMDQANTRDDSPYLFEIGEGGDKP